MQNQAATHQIEFHFLLNLFQFHAHEYLFTFQDAYFDSSSYWKIHNWRYYFETIIYFFLHYLYKGLFLLVSPLFSSYLFLNHSFCNT